MKNKVLFLGLVLGTLITGPLAANAQHSSSASQIVSITVLPRHELNVASELRFKFESSVSNSNVSTSSATTRINMSEPKRQIRLTVGLTHNDTEAIQLRLASDGQPSIPITSTSLRSFTGNVIDGKLDLVVEAEANGDHLYGV